MRTILCSLLVLCGAVGRLAGQSDAMARAYELERRGNFQAAAERYFEVLRGYPDNLSALLGLERALVPLRREAELAVPAEALLARDPGSIAAYSVAMRGWAAANRMDSVAAVAKRWATADPQNELPYREWGSMLMGQRDPNGARRAFLLGREQLGDPAALSGELALLSASQGDWEGAAQEWALAIGRYPGYRLSARNALVQAPRGEQTKVLWQLSRSTPAGRRLAGELSALWGDPVGGYALLVGDLPASDEEAVDALRQFLDAARAVPGPEAARVRGQALEQVADRTPGSGASRLRLEAARAYADGGDAVSARRMLGALAADGSAPPDMAAGATATLVSVLLREGRVEEAERQLGILGRTLGAENADRLTLQVAEAWIRQGRLDRAEAVVAADSSVEAMALSGMIRLYRGDLAGASTALRNAGPFAGTREAATARTATLTLIQPIATDSLPALGAALLLLARGDSAAGVTALVGVANTLPPSGGGAELRLLAGRIEALQGHPEPAERLFRAASDSTAPATAPAAELELARLLLSLGRNVEAVEHLEHVVLTYPGSASVPQARRLLDTARGRIPES